MILALIVRTHDDTPQFGLSHPTTLTRHGNAFLENPNHCDSDNGHRDNLWDATSEF